MNQKECERRGKNEILCWTDFFILLLIIARFLFPNVVYLLASIRYIDLSILVSFSLQLEGKDRPPNQRKKRTGRRRMRCRKETLDPRNPRKRRRQGLVKRMFRAKRKHTATTLNEVGVTGERENDKGVQQLAHLMIHQLCVQSFDFD